MLVLILWPKLLLNEINIVDIFGSIIVNFGLPKIPLKLSMHPLKNVIVNQIDKADEDGWASQSRVTNVGHWQKVSRHELQVNQFGFVNQCNLTDFARSR